jgi:hypothetical protein
VLAIVLLAGPASAGYWEVVYDLSGSTLQTKPPIGPTDIDPINGTLTIQYDAATESAPLTGARMVAGNTYGAIAQPDNPPGTFFQITGYQKMTLLPQAGGAPGTITGATLNWAVDVEDSARTGFLHCNEFTGQVGNCVLAGMVHTVPLPQTPTGPGPFPESFPKFVFAATAGVGNFTSTVKTQTVQTGAFTVTLYTTYIGTEISRVWNSGATEVPSISSGGLAMLGLCVGAIGVGGALWLQRRRRS